MDITLTNNVDEIYIEYNQVPRYLAIHYTGMFVGELFGDVRNCWVEKHRVVIEFKTNPEEVLMKYMGNLTIKQAFAYDKNKNRYKVKTKTIKDEVHLIQSKWDTSTQKYEDYNRSNKYNTVGKTWLTFTRNGEKLEMNNKSKYRIINGNNNR